MIKKLLQAAIVAVGGLALGGCPLEQAKTSAPADKPPAADYQAAAAGRAARDEHPRYLLQRRRPGGLPCAHAAAWN